MSYILKSFWELLSQQAENNLAWEDLTHLTAHSSFLLLCLEYFSLDNRNKTNERGQHHKVRSRINFDMYVNSLSQWLKKKFKLFVAFCNSYALTCIHGTIMGFHKNHHHVNRQEVLKNSKKNYLSSTSDPALKAKLSSPPCTITCPLSSMSVTTLPSLSTTLSSKFSLVLVPSSTSIVATFLLTTWRARR